VILVCQEQLVPTVTTTRPRTEESGLSSGQSQLSVSTVSTTFYAEPFNLAYYPPQYLEIL